MSNLPYFTFKIGGQAGQGVKSAGLMFARLATRSGYWVHNHTEYPSIIRGGHNVTGVTVSAEPVFAPTKHTNLLIALNRETLGLHQAEFVAGSLILIDESIKAEKDLGEKVTLLSLPLNKLARESGGVELIANTVALGAAAALLSADLRILFDLIETEFGDKDSGLSEANKTAAKLGYDFATTNYSANISPTLRPKEDPTPRSVVNADDTVAFGAIAAGMQFAAIYPMTPTSNILHVLAPLQQKYGFIYKQPEDEISGVNMAIGASFAGARSMVATSGGGFCLMTEAYGLAGMTETPLVIIEGMRGGPATGLPTWSEQGDLRFVLHAHQGEFPKIILAAGDPEEAFHLTLKAFNLADKYQTPVVVLIDKNICEDDESYSPFDYSRYQVNRGKLTTDKLENYARFVPTDDGISPRTLPGTGNHFVANSDEHNSVGYSTEEIPDRLEQMQKRMKKLELYVKEDLPPPTLYGPEQADVTIVSWGSNKGAIREALRFFPNVNFLHLTRIQPFPDKAVADILSKSKTILNIECNFSAQMAGLIRERTGIGITNHLLRYDGRPVYPEDVIEKLNTLISKPVQAT